MESILFDPPATAIPQLLDALGDADASLRAIADHHNTTTEALSAWMTRSDIAERISAIETAVARRMRLVAGNFLLSVVAAMANIIDACAAEEKHVPVDPRSPQALEQRRRNRETAARAGSLLLRLARFHAGPARARVPSAPVAEPRTPESRKPHPPESPHASRLAHIESLLSLLDPTNSDADLSTLSSRVAAQLASHVPVPSTPPTLDQLLAQLDTLSPNAAIPTVSADPRVFAYTDSSHSDTHRNGAETPPLKLANGHHTSDPP